MKTKKRLSLRRLVLFALLIGLFAHEDAGATQRARQGIGLVPLTDGEAKTMIYIREEEKLARDVYIAMHELWGEAIFSNISVSEQRHMDAVLQLLVKYGIPDPASGNPVGVFTNQDLQKHYDDLVFQGQASIMNAYIVGRLIEEMDINDLQIAIDETSKPDLDNVYGNIQKGSYNHLRAFNSHIEGLTQ